MTKENFKHYVEYIREWEALYDPFDPATQFGRKLMIDVLADAMNVEPKQIELLINNDSDPDRFYETTC